MSAVFDRKDAVVLTIDLQNEFRRDGVFPVEGYDRVLENAAEVIAAARGSGVPVIHAQAWVSDEHRDEYPLLRDHTPGVLRTAVAGSAGAEICAEVGPRDGETVIRKRWPSAFHATDLGSRLGAIGARQLIVIGVWTESCVRATVIDAVFQGYAIWLVKDACGSGTETMHRVGVLDLANRLYGGGVLTACEAAKALRSEAFAAWRCSRPVEFHYTCDTIDPLYEAL